MRYPFGTILGALPRQREEPKALQVKPESDAIPTEKAQKLSEFRDRFVTLCTKAVPRINTLIEERRAHAGDEFDQLCRHPKVASIIVGDDFACVKTTMVHAYRREFGEYLVLVKPTEKENSELYEISNRTRTVNGYLHPHISAPGGQFCMPENTEIYDLLRAGELRRAVSWLIDALHQVNDAQTFPGAHLTDWPQHYIDSKGDEHVKPVSGT